MAQVRVKNVTCTVNDGVEVCHGDVDVNEIEAIALIKELSMELESAAFDVWCYQYFRNITDNCCANQECNKR